MTVQLITGDDFSVNGRMQGTIKLCDENGKFLGPQWRGDLASTQYLKQVTKELLVALQHFDPEEGVTEERAKRLLWQVSALAQQQADREAAQPAPYSAPQLVQHNGLPTINVTQIERLEQIEKAWSALKAVNRPTPQYFRYGAQIANVEESRPRVLNKAALTGVLLRSAHWVKGSAAGHEVSTDPPEAVVEDMMHYGVPDLPELRGVKVSPFCRPDGSIVTEPGYDEDSRYMLKEHGLKLNIRDVPTADDIAAARSLLFDSLLKDFMFVSDSDRAHEVAAMLTPVVMPMIDGPIPMFMFTAPTPRSGKGKLATIASIIGTGFSPPPQAAPLNDESWRKIITAKLKAAAPVVNIDNISETKKLVTPSLAALLTSDERIWSDREMGTSRDLVLPNNTLWLATANNVNMHDEVVGRMVEISIDPQVERPELRKIVNPDNAPSIEAWTKANRGRLLSAVLTFVQAWVREGKPRGDEVFGSFDIWAQTIGGILQVAGIPGLLKNRERFRERAASELDEIRPFIGAWDQLYQDRDVSVNTLLTMCTADGMDLLPGVREGLRLEQARERLSQFLRSMQHRVFEVEQIRYRIVRGGKTETRRNGWKLEVVG